MLKIPEDRVMLYKWKPSEEDRKLAWKEVKEKIEEVGKGLRYNIYYGLPLLVLAIALMVPFYELSSTPFSLSHGKIERVRLTVMGIFVIGISLMLYGFLKMHTLRIAEEYAIGTRGLYVVIRVNARGFQFPRNFEFSWEQLNSWKMRIKQLEHGLLFCPAKITKLWIFLPTPDPESLESLVKSHVKIWEE